MYWEYVLQTILSETRKSLTIMQLPPPPLIYILLINTQLWHTIQIRILNHRQQKYYHKSSVMQRLHGRAFVILISKLCKLYNVLKTNK
jgi:hypothetical protein